MCLELQQGSWHSFFWGGEVLYSALHVFFVLFFFFYGIIAWCQSATTLFNTLPILKDSFLNCLLWSPQSIVEEEVDSIPTS